MKRLQDVVKPTIITSEISSLASLKMDVIKEKPVFSKRKLRVVYIIRIIIAISVVLFAVVYGENKLEISGVGIVAKVIKLIAYNIKLPAMVIYLSATNFYAKNIANFMNALYNVAEQMEEIGWKKDYRKLFIIQRVWLYFTAFKAILETAMFTFDEVPSWSLFFDSVVFNVPLTLAHILAINWITYIGLLMLHFRGLNDILKTLKYRQCFVIEDLKATQKLPVAFILKQCSLIYNELCRQSININNAYAWQFLYLMPGVFVVVMNNTFEILRMLKQEIPFTVKPVIIDVLYLILFLEFVMPCEFCKTESYKFNNILNKVDLKITHSKETEDVVSKLASASITRRNKKDKRYTGCPTCNREYLNHVISVKNKSTRI